MQPVSVSPASLQVSQFQLQGLQAAGAQRAAEQLQEKRAGHHTCQLEQQPPAPCGAHVGWDGENCSHFMVFSAARCDLLEIDKTTEKQSVNDGNSPGHAK